MSVTGNRNKQRANRLVAAQGAVEGVKQALDCAGTMMVAGVDETRRRYGWARSADGYSSIDEALEDAVDLADELAEAMAKLKESLNPAR